MPAMCAPRSRRPLGPSLPPDLGRIGRRALLAAAVAVGVVGPFGAQAQVNLDAPFDPARLESRDLRVLQAALTLTGDYNALLDGAWGRGSAGALDNWVARRRGPGPVRMADLLPLLREWEDERRASGWLGLTLPDLGLSLIVPALLARAQPFDDPDWRDAVFWRADGGAFQIIAGRLPEAARNRLHRDVQQAHDGDEEQYVLRRSDLWVTGQLRADGRRAYMRSDLGDAVTVLAQAAPEHRFRLALVAASYSRRPVPDLSPTPDGLLATLMAEALR